MPPPDGARASMHIDALAVLDTIRRTEKLIEKFRQLKKHGGSRAELGRLRAEINELKAFQAKLLARKGEEKGFYEQYEALHATLPRSDGLMMTPHFRSDGRPCETVDAAVQVGGTPVLRGGYAAEQKRGPTETAPLDVAQPFAYAASSVHNYRRHRSVAFAVVLAEAHMRREIVHKCDKRRLKLISRFREGCIIIALSTKHGASHVLSKPESLTSTMNTTRSSSYIQPAPQNPHISTSPTVLEPRQLHHKHIPHATQREEHVASNSSSRHLEEQYTNAYSDPCIFSSSLDIKKTQTTQTLDDKAHIHNVDQKWTKRKLNYEEEVKRRAEEEAAKRRAEEEAAKRRAEEE
ncbi:kinetoplast DNA-associated protein, partial [Trypanosoma rangeli]